MKRLLTIVLLLAVAVLPLRGQESVYKYWVRLTDKAGSTYSLQEPSAFLSQRALERRTRQNIALDSLDLPVSEAYVSALRALGFVVQNRSKWLNGVTVFATSNTMAAVLDTLPFVRSYRLCDYSEVQVPEGSVFVLPDTLPIVSSAPEPFSMRYYHYAYPQIALMNGVSLHRAGYRGEGLLVGVCDGGFPAVDKSAFFDSLRNEGRLLATRDFVWSGDSVYNVHQHGTMVLSTMAANVPGLYVGTAPKASYVLCRTENTLSETPLEEYNWVAAAEYLDSLGADIITTSLGYFFFDDSTMNHTLQDLDGQTDEMSQAADVAVSRGMLVLNAAGNDGIAALPHLNVPADAERVLTVGACDEEGKVCVFSSFGPTYDQRIKPDVMAMGQEVVCLAGNGTLSMANGTSLATPILAGMMACLWQRYPMLTPGALCDSVRTWGSLSDSVDQHGGYGVPDFGRVHLADTMAHDGIEAIDGENILSFFPNPATDVLWCKVPHSGMLIFADSQGRDVWRQRVEEGKCRLALPNLSRGLYCVRLITHEGMAVGKLLLQ